MFEYLFFLFTDDILIVSCKFIPECKIIIRPMWWVIRLQGEKGEMYHGSE